MKIVGLLAVFCLLYTGVYAEDFSSSFSEYKTDSNIIRIVDKGPHEGASIGSYAIYVYDDQGVGFIAGLVEPRDGEVHKVWVQKGKRNTLRLYVWTVSAGSGSYGTFDRYAFGGKILKKLSSLPTPKQKYLKGYGGHEEYDTTEKEVLMKFPVYKSSDSEANPTGGTRCLAFSLKNGKWSESKKCKE